MSKNWEKLLKQAKQHIKNVQKSNIAKDLKQKIQKKTKQTSQNVSSFYQANKKKANQKQSQMKEKINKRMSGDIRKSTYQYLQKQKQVTTKKVSKGLNQVSNSLSKLKEKVYNTKNQQKDQRITQQKKDQSKNQGFNEKVQQLYKKYKSQWPSNPVSKISKQVIDKANNFKTKINQIGPFSIRKRIFNILQQIYIRILVAFLLGILVYSIGKAIPRQIRLYLQGSGEPKKQSQSKTEEKIN